MSRSFSLTFTHKMAVTGENGSRTLGFVSRCALQAAPDILILEPDLPPRPFSG
jgi:hypothetical protein